MGHLFQSTHPSLRPRRDRVPARYFDDIWRGLDREIRGECVMHDGMGAMIWHPRRLSPRIRYLMLAEDHPGWGEVFCCYDSVWNPTTDCWEFDCDATFSEMLFAVDFFWGGNSFVYPDAGACGWFKAYPSDGFGTLWHCINCDCEARTSCGTQGGSGTLYVCGSGSGTCWGSGTGTGTGT